MYALHRLGIIEAVLPNRTPSPFTTTVNQVTLCVHFPWEKIKIQCYIKTFVGSENSNKMGDMK